MAQMPEFRQCEKLPHLVKKLGDFVCSFCKLKKTLKANKRVWRWLFKSRRHGKRKCLKVAKNTKTEFRQKFFHFWLKKSISLSTPWRPKFHFFSFFGGKIRVLHLCNDVSLEVAVSRTHAIKRQGLPKSVLCSANLARSEINFPTCDIFCEVCLNSVNLTEFRQPV